MKQLVIAAVVSCALGTQAETAADWVGVGVDAHTSTLANWQVGGETPATLSLKDGSVAATLKGGTVLQYEAGDSLDSLANGISVPYTKSGSSITIDSGTTIVPFRLEPATEGATLTLAKGLSSPLGNTQLILKGHFAIPEGAEPGEPKTSPYACSYTGLAYAKGTVTGAIEPPSSKLGTGSTPLVLDGMTLEAPLRVFMSGIQTTVYALPNTVNTFNGAVSLESDQSKIWVSTGSVICFNAGVSAVNYHHLGGFGEIRFVNKPVFLGNGSYIEDGAKVVFDSEGNDASGNSSREGIYLEKGTVECLRDNCFADTLQLSTDNNGSQKTFEFHQTTQTLGRISFRSTRSADWLHGDYPAMIEVTGKSRTGAADSQLKALEVGMQTKGGLGFHMKAAGQRLSLMNNIAFESCGDLVVSAGTLALTSGTTWLNGTNFVMRGEGTMEFSSSGQVNRDFARFRFADNGRVAVGGILEISTAVVVGANGEESEVPAGEYTASSTGLMAGRVTSGTLKVLGAGHEIVPYVETTEDMTAKGDWEVSVDTGCTNAVTVAQTGAGKIIKRGQGILILRTTNSFTGGIDLHAGYVFADESDCLGFGTVTIDGSEGVGPCELRFTASGKTFGSSESNGQPAIRVLGQTTAAYPAIGIHGVTNAFWGNISAANDLFIEDDYQWLYDWYKAQKGSAKWSTDVAPNPAMDFHGAIDVVGTLHLLPDAFYNFYGPISADTFESVYNGDVAYRTRTDTNDESSYAAIAFHAANRFKTFRAGYRSIRFLADDAMGGASVTNIGKKAQTGSYQGGNGVNLTVADFYHDKPADGTYASFARVNSSSAFTVTVTGTTANAECATYTIIRIGTSLVLDAKDNPGFTLTFRERASDTGGSLSVPNGTLKLTEGATFPNAASLTVGENGAVIVEGGPEGTFAAVETLAVDGALTARADAFASEQVALSLGTNACLALEGEAKELTFLSLTYDGELLQAGPWTHDDIPAIPEGLTINAKTGSSGGRDPELTADWTGAAGDGKMSTLGNWLVNGEVPASLDLTSGTTVVRITGGTEMIPEDGMRINAIVNLREANMENGPFTIGAPGVTLTVDLQILSDQKAQLILRGTIATPRRRPQGEAIAAKNAGIALYYVQAKLMPAAVSPDTIWGEGTTNGGVPLVLDGAVVEKPVYIGAYSMGSDAYYALPNTVNELRGNVYETCGGWHTITPDAGSTVTLSGGCAFGTRPVKRRTGTLVVKDVPWSTTTGFNLEGGTLVLDAEGNSFVGTPTQNYGLRLGASGTPTLRFARSGCMKDTDKEQLDFCGANNSTVDFGTTTQLFSRVKCVNTGKNSVMTGEYPAMLEVKGGTKLAAANAFAGMTNSVQVTGGLGFHYLGNGPALAGGIPAGSEDTLVLAGKDFESCGNLEVDAGTLELAANATWRNGLNLVARGTGTLKVGRSRAVGKQAVLRFEGEGRFVQPAGAIQKVAECWVGGTKVETGIYAAADLKPGDPLYEHLKGGILRVGKLGGMLIVR